MIAVFLAAAQFMFLGLPAAWLLDARATPRRLIGTAFLLGTGLVSLILLALSLFGIDWTFARVTLACYLAAAGLFGGALVARRRRRAAVDEAPAIRRKATSVIPALFVDLMTVMVVLSHVILATVARVGEWDFWAIWGLKARVFLEHRAIDWAFLEDPYHLFAHPDYPPLLPLDYVFIALRGGWDDRWMGILTTLFAVALLLIVRDAFEEELPPLFAALATLGVASIPLTRSIGMAEAPLIAFGTAGMLMIRRGSLALGSVLLGFAALTKNEGVALVVAVLLAMALSSRRREIPRLWPALAIAAPWLALRALHSLATDLAAGAVGDRLMGNLAHVGELMIGFFDSPPNRPVYWIAVLAALLLCAKDVRRERFLLFAVLIQLGFYLCTYVVTPNDLQWQVAESWPRLLDQMGVALGFVALILLGRLFLAPKWNFVDSGG